jgi:hypothetical protein
LEGKPHRGTLHQRMVEEIPLGPINVPVLIAQGVFDKIVTATSADGIQDVVTHTDKLFDDLGIYSQSIPEVGKPPVPEDVIIEER